MQSPEKVRVETPSESSDQVVVLLDQPYPNPNPNNLKPRLSPQNSPDSLHQEKSKTKTPTTSFTTTATTIRTLRRLQFSKPKARFVEFERPYPLKSTTTMHHGSQEPDPACLSDEDDRHRAQEDDEERLKEEDEEEEEEEGKEEEKLPSMYQKRRRRKVRWRTIVELVAFVVIMACLVSSRAVGLWKEQELWGLALWRWYLMVLVVFSGRLVAGWVVGLLALLIERNFMLREKVLYFVYGLRKSVRNCGWLGLVLLAWYVMFNPEIEESTRNHRILWRVWRALIAFTIGAVMWLVKIILVKVLASSFHVATFFDRTKESVFHHLILEKLSGPPLDEAAHQPRQTPGEEKTKMKKAAVASARLTKKVGGMGSRRIDMEKLRRLSREKPSGFGVRRLVNHVMWSGLSTISTTVDETMQGFKETEAEILSERQARTCAKRIFKNVARPGAKYIEVEDLLRFLDEEEVHTIFPLFEGAAETGKINKSAFRNWMVRAYLERKALAHSLNDTKTAVQQLHKLASAIVIVIIIVMSLLVMEVATTKVIFLFTSQLVLAGFMFGNTCKTIFESIIFVFVMHPFDVGDRCIVDGVQMVVEEMNILTTVFLRYDNEKIYYPNSVLLTMPISNFKRSPEMGDRVDFEIDASTSTATFTAMKEAIRKYIESKPEHWQLKHFVVVQEIEKVNKMEITLLVIHTINFQNYAEKICRRSELILELKKIFESLDIKYHLLPQEVRLSQVCLPSARVPAPASVPQPVPPYPVIM